MMSFSHSFTFAEILLAKNRTPVQRLVYLMAKTIFYTYLDIHDEINPKLSFPSYALKTCMMWLMEQTPLDKWTEDNVWSMLQELFGRLQDAVEKGKLDGYFIVGLNVLKNCPRILLKKAYTKLQQIRED